MCVAYSVVREIGCCWCLDNTVFCVGSLVASAVGDELIPLILERFALVLDLTFLQQVGDVVEEAVEVRGQEERSKEKRVVLLY